MKIAVITHNWHGAIGGIEKYNRSIYKSFTDHKFVEFPLFFQNNAKSKFNNVVIDNLLNDGKFRNTIWLKAYGSKKLKKIFKDFDLVIFSANAPARKWIKNSKSLVVQHMDKDWYFLKQKTFADKFVKLFSWLFGIDTLTNTLKRSARVFYYSKDTSFDVKGQTAYFAPLTSKVNIVSTKRSGSISVGRVDKKHKNIPELIKVANKIESFELYGDGKDVDYIYKNLSNGKKFKGSIKSDQVDKKLQMKRTFVMTSNYEGFSYAVVEALANGCAVCMYDTFDACKFFAKCESVFLFKKNDSEAMVKKINDIENLSSKDFLTLSRKSTDFAKKELSDENFKKAWSKIIK